MTVAVFCSPGLPLSPAWKSHTEHFCDDLRDLCCSLFGFLFGFVCLFVFLIGSSAAALLAFVAVIPNLLSTRRPLDLPLE